MEKLNMISVVLVILFCDLTIFLSGFRFELNSDTEEGIEGNELLWTCNINLTAGEDLPGGVRFFLNKEKICSLSLTRSKCKKTKSSIADCFCSDISNSTFFLNITLHLNHTGNWTCGEIRNDGHVSSTTYLNVNRKPRTIIPPQGSRTSTSTESESSTSTTALIMASTQVTPSPVRPSSNNHYIYIGIIIGGVLCLTLCIVVIRKKKAHHQSRNDKSSTKEIIRDNNTPKVEIIENVLYEGSDDYFARQNSQPQIEIIENEVYQGSDDLH